MPTKIPNGLRNRVEAGRMRRSLNGNGNGHGTPTFNEMVPDAEVRDQVFNFVTNLALTRVDAMRQMFDPRRDIDDECGYPKEINASQYRYMFDREGIATRVVSVYPEECWKQDPKIFETEDEQRTTFEAAFDDLEEELNLFHYMQRIDTLSGIGTYGVLLLGYDDGKELHEPVDGIILEGANTGRKQGFDETTAAAPAESDMEGAQGENDGESGDSEAAQTAEPWDPERHLMYVRALDESLCAISSYETNQENRRYGLPTYYNITFNDPRNQGTNTTAAPPDLKEKRVHWTRVIHVADGRTSSEVFGTPRQQPPWNRLYDLRKLLGGSAEMFWKGAFPGYSFETDPELGAVDIDDEAIREKFYAFSNGLQRYLALVGLKANSLAPQVSSPEDHVMVQIKAICITIKCPLRIFMGSEAAHLASTQDQEAWNGRLKHRQEKYLTPMLVKPLIDRLIAVGVLPEPEDPSGFHVEWPDLNTETDEDKAKVADLVVKAIAAYISSGADTLIPPFEFLTMVLGFEEKEAEAILDAAMQHVEDTEDAEVDERQRREEKGLGNEPLPGEEFDDVDDSFGGGDGQGDEEGDE